MKEQRRRPVPAPAPLSSSQASAPSPHGPVPPVARGEAGLRLLCHCAGEPIKTPRGQSSMRQDQQDKEARVSLLPQVSAFSLQL